MAGRIQGRCASKGCDDTPPAARSEGRAQRNPLVSAMMEALKGLMPADAGTAEPKAADGTEAGRDAEATKEQAKALKEAAYGFAHELFQALKAVGASGVEAAGTSNGCRPHRCGGYGERKGGAAAYDGLAQGLQRLAQTIAPTPAASAAEAAAPTTPLADATTTAVPVTGAPAPRAPVQAAPAKAAELTTVKTPAPAGMGNSITINLTVNFGTATEATAATASNESPLLAAFKKLMLALNPKAGAEKADAADAADAKKPAEMLQAFLQQIAKALGADGSTAGDALPAKGSLVNLSA